MNVDLKAPVTQYTLVTLSYWAFTLSDGALRMLVVLFFHQLGYSPIEIAGLLVLYELFGVITNLYAGWLATTIGLTVTMQMGLGLQIAALVMLMVDSSILNVVYVMAAQALSGIGKDLNKMGAKASIKSLVPADAQGRLYRWIALLTGSKNALKGVGFFLGGWLLATVGFQHAVAIMASVLGLVCSAQYSACWTAPLASLKNLSLLNTCSPKAARSIDSVPRDFFYLALEIFGLSWRCRYFCRANCSGAMCR